MPLLKDRATSVAHGEQVNLLVTLNDLTRAIIDNRCNTLPIGQSGMQRMG